MRRVCIGASKGAGRSIPSRGRWREILAVIAVEGYGLPVVDSAREMRKSPDSLTKAIRRATERRVEQREYDDTRNMVDSSIAAG